MGRRNTAKRGTGHTYNPSGVAAALSGLIAGAVRRQPRDMSLTSVSTLSTLDRTGPRRITDLAAIEGVTQPSMTVLVTALERTGLVERQGDPADKRVALVALTAAGLDYVRTRRRTSAESFERLIAELPTDEATALSAAIPALKHLQELDNQQREPATRPPVG